MTPSGPTPDAQTLRNARDVGGLAAVDGRLVRPGVLYRSDAPLHGDAAPSLHPWPPQHVVDLRSPAEIGDRGHPLGEAGATVISTPLLTANPLATMARADDEGMITLEEGYPTLLQNGAVFSGVARLIASAEGPVLVHCSAGKDRTGVVVAVTLAAVGVRREEIVRDYVATERAIDQVVDRMAQTVDEAERDGLLASIAARHPHLMQAPAGAIEAVLDVLDAEPGGVAGWLERQGATEQVLQRLRLRMLAEG